MFLICVYGNRLLLVVDIVCVVFIVVVILVMFVCLFVKVEVGRNEVGEMLGGYDISLSGWGGFSFFIGVLLVVYMFSVIGMVLVMVEECDDLVVKLLRVIVFCVLVGGVVGFFFVCFVIFFVCERELLIIGVDYFYMCYYVGFGIYFWCFCCLGFVLYFCCCYGFFCWGFGIEYFCFDYYVFLFYFYYCCCVVLYLGVCLW